MQTNLLKRKVPKRRPPQHSRRVSKQTDESRISLNVDEKVKADFVAALEVGRTPTQTEALVALMVAYAEATKRDGRQPDFPLEVWSKGARPKK